ncbi:MAG TPA: hypothetical protein VK919_00435 [Solirubrobacterales bacterium]|nr:hypothetical protein [Solirubrobacterales bacterium]
MPVATSFTRRASRRLLGAATLAAALAAALAAPGASGAAETTTDAVHVPQTAERSCLDGVRHDPAAARVRGDSPATAAVSAQLEDAGGSWQLAVFEADGRIVAASAHPGGDQVAQGFATRPGELVVQACRRSGGDPSARLAVEVVELTEPAPQMQVLRVATADEATEPRLLGLGLDLTEHGGEGFVDLVSRRPSDRALLEAKGFDLEVLEPDLRATSPPPAPPSAAAWLRRLCPAGGPGPTGGWSTTAPSCRRSPTGTRASSATSPSPCEPTRAGRSRRSRLLPGSGAATAARCSCRWAPTMRASGPPPSTRSSSRTS